MKAQIKDWPVENFLRKMIFAKEYETSCVLFDLCQGNGEKFTVVGLEGREKGKLRRGGCQYHHHHYNYQCL